MKTKILFGSAIVLITMVTLSGVLKYSSDKDEASNRNIVEAFESQIYHAEIKEWVS